MLFNCCFNSVYLGINWGNSTSYSASYSTSGKNVEDAFFVNGVFNRMEESDCKCNSLTSLKILLSLVRLR